MTNNDLVRLVISFFKKEKLLKEELEMDLDKMLTDFLIDTETEVSKKSKNFYENHNVNMNYETDTEIIPKIPYKVAYHSSENQWQKTAL